MWRRPCPGWSGAACREPAGAAGGVLTGRGPVPDMPNRDPAAAGEAGSTGARRRGEGDDGVTAAGLPDGDVESV
jgi:hypothetical protein